ncbi:MAG: hypothetical protein HC846_06620, partial [Blastocatellia bacterium]|nr:hypothetical protein [Blastocatellia bacterium]
MKEAKAEQEKLPVEMKPIVKPENQFAEADKAKSIKMFRTAFATLLEKPLENELQASNITSYINTLRQEENLDVIAERLFELRKIYLMEISKKDSELAGEARNRLKILDGAMVQTIGNIAKTVGTNEELQKLHTNLNQQIDEVSNDEQLVFFQDLTFRVGFGDLVEKILIKRRNMNALTDFYKERGAFQKILELAEAENNLPLIAENAKLVGNREKELNALRQIFQDKNANQSYISRYLQIVDKAELEALSKQNSPHQLQLINFLIGKGEKELAHSAIENSNFQTAWKLARNAETSLALKEFDNESECYFCDALKFGSIGELTTAQPNKTQHLIGADWFRLSRQYGEWLGAKNEVDADKFLPAMTEFLPKDAKEQAKLGDYYWAKNDLQKAKAHILLVRELDENDIYNLAKWCRILWETGEKDKAQTSLQQLLSKSEWLYLETMREIGLTKQAHAKLLPILIKKLDEGEDIEGVIYKLADSFDSEKSKAEYFYRLVNESKESHLISQKIIQFELIAKEFRQSFYERLISKMEFDGYDYEFQ